MVVIEEPAGMTHAGNEGFEGYLDDRSGGGICVLVAFSSIVDTFLSIYEFLCFAKPRSF